MTASAGIQLVEHAGPSLREAIEIPYEHLYPCWSDSAGLSSRFGLYALPCGARHESLRRFLLDY